MVMSIISYHFQFPNLAGLLGCKKERAPGCSLWSKVPNVSLGMRLDMLLYLQTIMFIVYLLPPSVPRAGWLAMVERGACCWLLSMKQGSKFVIRYILICCCICKSSWLIYISYHLQRHLGRSAADRSLWSEVPTFIRYSYDNWMSHTVSMTVILLYADLQENLTLLAWFWDGGQETA